jgi:membrane associated rhomboid family serine protease
MFPIGDENVPNRGPAFVNLILIVINVVAFLYEISLGQNALQDFVTRWGVVPANIQAGSGYITLLTSMFLHGGWLHLIGNMVFLWVFGDNVESAFGHIGYLIFYLLGGLAASFTHIFFNMGSSIPSIGASGAIAAVLGAYIVMFPRARVRLLILAFGFYVTRTSALVFLGIWFVTQLLSGVASIGVNTAQTDGVAVWAHVGGFVFGLLAGFLMRSRVNTLPGAY